MIQYITHKTLQLLNITELDKLENYFRFMGKGIHAKFAAAPIMSLDIIIHSTAVVAIPKSLMIYSLTDEELSIEEVRKLIEIVPI